MPDPYKASEFGGKVRRNRTQPPPHEPTASEKLMLGYTTGDESGEANPDDGLAFSGLLSLEEQTRLREQAGDLKKGEIWEEMNR